MLILYKIALTMVSLLLMAVIYLINNGIGISELLKVNLCHNVPDVASFVIYIVVSLYLTKISTIGFSRLATITMRSANIKKIESADSTFVPMYFAYVFVGVSIQNGMSLIMCYLLIAIICFFAQSYYFNRKHSITFYESINRRDTFA